MKLKVYHGIESYDYDYRVVSISFLNNKIIIEQNFLFQ